VIKTKKQFKMFKSLNRFALFKAFKSKTRGRSIRSKRSTASLVQGLMVQSKYVQTVQTVTSRLKCEEISRREGLHLNWRNNSVEAVRGLAPFKVQGSKVQNTEDGSFKTFKQFKPFNRYAPFKA